jgi:hypothetical protein
MMKEVGEQEDRPPKTRGRGARTFISLTSNCATQSTSTQPQKGGLYHTDKTVIKWHKRA